MDIGVVHEPVISDEIMRCFPKMVQERTETGFLNLEEAKRAQKLFEAIWETSCLAQGESASAAEPVLSGLRADLEKAWLMLMRRQKEGIKLGMALGAAGVNAEIAVNSAIKYFDDYQQALGSSGLTIHLDGDEITAENFSIKRIEWLIWPFQQNIPSEQQTDAVNIIFSKLFALAQENNRTAITEKFVQNPGGHKAAIAHALQSTVSWQAALVSAATLTI